MESRKSKVLRIVKNIYNIKINSIVEITNSDNETYIFRCKCYDDNYDLYDVQDKHTSWGLSCDTIEDLRDSLLKDFIDELLINISIR